MAWVQSQLSVRDFLDALGSAVVSRILRYSLPPPLDPAVENNHLIAVNPETCRTRKEQLYKHHKTHTYTQLVWNKASFNITLRVVMVFTEMLGLTVICATSGIGSCASLTLV